MALTIGDCLNYDIIYMKISRIGQDTAPGIYLNIWLITIHTSFLGQYATTSEETFLFHFFIDFSLQRYNHSFWQSVEANPYVAPNHVPRGRNTVRNCKFTNLGKFNSFLLKNCGIFSHFTLFVSHIIHTKRYGKDCEL